MVTQQKEMLAALEEQGWECVEEDSFSWEWWADQVWLLRSKPQPLDYPIYLTFVVDSLWQGRRNKGEGVWAATASCDKPQQWSNVTLSLGRGWQERLPRFLMSIMDLRSSA